MNTEIFEKQWFIIEKKGQGFRGRPFSFLTPKLVVGTVKYVINVQEEFLINKKTLSRITIQYEDITIKNPQDGKNEEEAFSNWIKAGEPERKVIVEEQKGERKQILLGKIKNGKNIQIMVCEEEDFLKFFQNNL